MYIIQEKLDKDTWSDRYTLSDYALAVEFLTHFQEKYPNSKFRLTEVFIYV